MESSDRPLPGTSPHYFPDPNRLNVLTAAIVLAYILSRFIQLPITSLGVQLPGFYLAIPFEVNSIIVVLVALLTGAGADWLLADHPLRLGEEKVSASARLRHVLLPALTALVLGIPLAQISVTWQWWAALAAGALVLVLILIGEYIAIDPEDIRQPLATAWLTAVSYALYLVLAVGLRTAEVRLFLAVPTLAGAGGLLTLRTLHLRLHGEWTLIEAGLAALLLGQWAAALHYWPLSPVAFGLALLGPAYAFTGLVAGLGEGKTLREILPEVLISLLVCLGIAVWLH